MKYINRDIEPTILKALQHFSGIVLTGPRRAGKTFLLKNLFPKANYVLLEEPNVILAAKSDSKGFLAKLKTPVILDEIQNVPELFPYIRALMDCDPATKGQWLLTGSHEPLLMQGVTESMAGRVAILRISSFSQHEFPAITRVHGGYPEIVEDCSNSRLFFSSYVQTYLERDVRTLVNVRNLQSFHMFLKLLATRHGQQLNKSDLAAPLGLSVPTISEWLNILISSGIIFLLPPYYSNAGKRLVKTPKLYFWDSGLLCHLLGINDQVTLDSSPFYGTVFEGFVISEVARHFLSLGLEPDLYYYRDVQGLEADLLMPMGPSRLIAAEIKSNATPTPDMARNLKKLAALFERQSLESYLIYDKPASDLPELPMGQGISAVSPAELLDRLA